MERMKVNPLIMSFKNDVLNRSILHGVKIKITLSVVPVNLESSINVTSVSRCPNVCPIVLPSWVNIFLETSVRYLCYFGMQL